MSSTTFETNLAVQEQILDEIYSTVHKEIFATGWDKLTPDDVSKMLYKCCYGSHDANWLTFFSFFRVVVEAPEVRKAEGMEIVAENGGWWWPLRDIIVMTDRPLWMDIDDENEFHSEDRRAVEWGDGFGYYIWHGIQIPARIIEETDQITAEEIIGEENMEIRRIMMEKCGAERLLAAAKLLQEDDFGQLYKLSVPNDEDVVLVKVVNGTAEADGTHSEYVLRVNPNTRTAHEGVARSYGMSPEEYSPSLRT